MHRYSLLLVLASGLITQGAFAANSVVIESKTVAASADEVTVGVYIENDVAVTAAVFPFVIREVTPGSFIADTLAIRAANRLTTYMNGYVVISYLPSEDNEDPWNCRGGGFATRGQPDFTSPDAMFYAGVQGSTDSCLPAGDDGDPPGGTPSLQIVFGVTGETGTFEIDTTCVTPGNKLAFMDCNSHTNVIWPSFTKGVIEIGCECLCHADPQCDGYHDIVDWILIRDVARGTHVPIPDSSALCPVFTTDVNCDGVTNNTDRDLMYEVVFNSGDPDTLFCDPCP